MINTELQEIVTILRSIILQNQPKNIYESKMVNGLKFENNIISFTLELLPEQLKQSESIKKFIQEKLKTNKMQVPRILSQLYFE